MTANKMDFRIQGIFDDMQVIGRSLTRAISRAECRGDRKQAENLFLAKAELVKRLGEIFVPNDHGLEITREKLQIRTCATSIRNRLTPRQAIREHCMDSVGTASAIRDCQGNELYDRPCIFFSYRMGKGRPSVKLIRKFCLYCMGGSWKLVKNCPSKVCPFLRYRMGKNPNIQLSDGQRQQKRQKAAIARRHRLKPLKVPSGIKSFSQDRRTEHFSYQRKGEHF